MKPASCSVEPRHGNVDDVLGLEISAYYPNLVSVDIGISCAGSGSLEVPTSTRIGKGRRTFSVGSIWFTNVYHYGSDGDLIVKAQLQYIESDKTMGHVQSFSSVGAMTLNANFLFLEQGAG